MTARHMTSAFWDEAEETAADTPPPRRPPLLMGDIVTRRGGVPELLIQWRRAEGEDDPAPQ